MMSFSNINTLSCFTEIVFLDYLSSGITNNLRGSFYFNMNINQQILMY